MIENKTIEIKISFSLDPEKGPIPLNVTDKFENIDLIVTETDEFYLKVAQFIADILDDTKQPVDTWRSALRVNPPTKGFV